MYAVQLTIAPNTTRSSPEKVSLEVAPGIIRKVRILHPAGCADLVGVSIYYRASRLFPTNDDGFFLGNGFPIEFNPNTSLLEPPFVLEIQGYNDDDTYTHKPTVYIELEFAGSNADRERGILNTIFSGFGLRSGS